MTSYRSFNPWVVVFLGTAVFHFWRGSVADAAIFSLASILVWSQVFGFTDFGLAKRPAVGRGWLAGVVIVSAWSLYFSPRHGLQNVITLVLIAVAGLALLWYRDPADPAPLTQSIRRARLTWALWAFCFTVVELVAFVYGYLNPAEDDNLPTISAVMDPILDQPLGRAIFVAIWLALGVFMFGVRRK